MRRGALLLLLSACLLQGDTAIGRVVVTAEPVSGSTLIQGPSLTNGVLTWMSEDCVRACSQDFIEEWDVRHRVHVRYVGGRRSILARGRTGFSGSGPNSFLDAVKFFASETHLALVRTWFGTGEDEYDYGGLQLRAGAFGRAPATLARCQVDFFEGDVAPPALSGATIAYDATACRDDSMLVVRDLSSGDAWRLAYSGRKIRALDADGRYLALAAPSSPPEPAAARLAVLDLDQRGTRYERDLVVPPYFDSLDVARNGSLAVLTFDARPGCGSELTRYSSSGELQDTHSACDLVAHLSGETIVVQGDDSGQRIVELPAGAGAPRNVLELGRVPLKAADADRSKIAWVVPTCAGGDAMHLDDLDAPDIAVVRSRCPASLATRGLVAVPRRRADLWVRCPLGCTGTLTLRAGARRIGRRGYVLTRGRTRLGIRIRDWARRRLDSGPLVAHATLVVAQLDGTRQTHGQRLILTRR